jgi:hypothetical protein
MTHDSPGQPSSPPSPEGVTRLPYARAFVVRLEAGCDASRGTLSGRIEHLQTGRRRPFTSADELLAGILAMMEQAPPSPEDD